MKVIFLASALLFSFSSWGACSRSVDPNKVVFFVDTNFSDLEIATAERAACSRGETFVVVPSNYQSYTQLIRTHEQISRQRQSCTRNCEALETRAMEAYAALTNYQASQPSINTAIRNQLAQLRERGERKFPILRFRDMTVEECSAVSKAGQAGLSSSRSWMSSVT